MDLMKKLKILADAAKYDVACTSSGSERSARSNEIGSAMKAGCCHSFAGDGRCISLLKVLQTNVCTFDCAYCVNRRSNDTLRASFSPRELADLTMEFYRRNYIEGLFLSSGVSPTADATCERMYETLRILREEYRFTGYIHVKAIPGACSEIITMLGYLADRMSVNIELPSNKSLIKLAPDKSKAKILLPMRHISEQIGVTSRDMVRYRHAPKFAPAGQSTQMIIGASPESDFQILKLSDSLYKRYELKRVFYSAYIPVVDSSLLPSLSTPPPVWREHRHYQADWLLRFYGFGADELLDEEHQTFHPCVDPKCHWALRHPEYFPLEVNRASYEMLLRVPGIGVKSAQRIIKARKCAFLTWDALKAIGVVIKRAKYFLLAKGKKYYEIKKGKREFLAELMSPREKELFLVRENRQMSLFEQGGEPIFLSEAQRRELLCLSAPI